MDDLTKLCADEFSVHIDQLYSTKRIETFSDGPDWVEASVVGLFHRLGMRSQQRHLRSCLVVPWRQGLGSRSMVRLGRNHCRRPGRISVSWRGFVN